MDADIHKISNLQSRKFPQLAKSYQGFGIGKVRKLKLVVSMDLYKSLDSFNEKKHHLKLVKNSVKNVTLNLCQHLWIVISPDDVLTKL